MPSTGYVADTFVAGEQPTTSKWNELWGNDASFNSGNGFNDAIIINRHLANSAVKGTNISSPSSRAYADQNNQSFTANTAAQITGASITLATTGGKVFVAASCNQVYTAAGTAIIQLYIDGTYSVDLAEVSPGTATSKGGAVGFTVTSALGAGTHTFALYLYNATGASQLLQFNTYSFTAFEIGT